MDSRKAIKLGIDEANGLVEAYLADLTDADLLARPCEGINHIAWQLGHLIVAEHGMLEAVKPRSMPPLPEGFRERHGTEQATSDNPKDFFTKEEYLSAMRAQRAGTIAVLESMTDEQLDQEAPEALRSFLKSVGNVFTMQGTHWLMHAGQWAVIRRKLGRKPLF